MTSVLTAAAAAEVSKLDRRVLWHPWTPATADPLMVVAGSGAEVTDAAGRRYLDARAGMFNAVLGYGHPRVTAAVTDQVTTLMTYGLVGGATPAAVRLAARLADLLAGPNRTLFVHSGSEATDAAITIARQWHRLAGRPQRQVILSLADGYHGCTGLAAAASGLAAVRAGRDPMPAGFAAVATPRCPHPPDTGHDGGCPAAGLAALADTVDAVGADRVAALIVEPVLGVGGVRALPPGWLAGARRLCDQTGILLIVDEVLTGLGRTGVWFAHQRDGVTPDVVTCAKGLTGGYAPLAAVTVTDAVADMFATDPLLGGLRHGHTTGGHAAACAAALAVLDVIAADQLVAYADVLGQRLRARLGADLRGRPGVRAVRGVGLLAGVEYDTPARAGAVADGCRRAGVLVRQQGPVVAVAPPLILTSGQADRIAETLALATGGAR